MKLRLRRAFFFEPDSQGDSHGRRRLDHPSHRSDPRETPPERLEEEKKEVAEQIKEIYAEAKAFGFDTKALRQVIKLRKVDKAEREEQEMVLDTYLLALGEA